MNRQYSVLNNQRAPRSEVLSILYQSKNMMSKDDAWAKVNDDAKSTLSKYLPNKGKNKVTLSSPLVQFPLFNVAPLNRKRQDVMEFSFLTPTKQQVSFKGPELRQDDMLMFITILSLVKEQRAGQLGSIRRSEITRLLNREPSGTEYKRIDRSIDRLQRSLVTMETAEGTVSVQLIGKVARLNDASYRIALDESILKLFAKGYFSVDLTVLSQLSIGLQSFLYLYISSLSFVPDTDLTDLKQTCGSIATAREFKRCVGNALKGLKERDLILDFYFYKNTLTIIKSPSMAKE